MIIGRTRDYVVAKDLSSLLTFELAGMGIGLSDLNLDEIANMASMVFGGLRVATLMRCRTRDEMTGAAHTPHTPL